MHVESPSSKRQKTDSLLPSTLSTARLSIVTSYLRDAEVRSFAIAIHCRAGTEQSRQLYLNHDLERPSCARCDSSIRNNMYFQFCDQGCFYYSMEYVRLILRCRFRNLGEYFDLKAMRRLARGLVKKEIDPDSAGTCFKEMLDGGSEASSYCYDLFYVRSKLPRRVYVKD